MRKYGGFIPGIRPGKKTSEYIETILNRITFAGAIYLAMIAIIPEFMISGFHVHHLPFGRYLNRFELGLNGMGVNFTLEGLPPVWLCRHDMAAGRGAVGHAAL
jgi:preprotein translocase subunit SecY